MQNGSRGIDVEAGIMNYWKRELGIAYLGARPSMEISGDLIKDRQWLCELVTLTADDLPIPKPKKPKK